ncbi:40S ribosomal protein S10-like [Hydractinia symbiolongicarpus]|uniref:40S ribosomal protein S10-like n=1 Tax=Hydractinia symbiolongicarpus TaxID=13093 RepID=UPI00254E1D28|nr:40S ribosomal protein S10-like [Hydractinia symbiolongicarpus]XP_057317511.1 40S ribosomal protein S10-like [Hydractinia symbiolongicarpus]
MIISKANRIAIYESLFKDGVMVAIKDFNLAKHGDQEKVRNLEVIKAMQSLKSRGYVRENFAWRHYYWYVTNEGIQYLRDFLHLPPEIVPATLKKSTKPSDAPKPWAKGGDQRSSGPRGGDSSRDSYRRDGGASDKAGAGADFNPEFRAGYGGLGRGAPTGGFGAPPS